VMYSNVLQAFVKEMVQVPEQVHDHLRADEQSHAVRALHTLKGLAATVGARHLAAVAARLEHKLRSGALPHEHVDVVESLRAAINALTDTLVPVLQQYQEAQLAPAAAPSAPLDRVKLCRDLHALAALLRESDMVALDANSLVQEAYAGYLPAALQPLNAAMAGLDFSAALVVCEALLQKYEATP
jgi:two-component system sensor histidine kinase/response regulator